jgi:shikimate kinase
VERYQLDRRLEQWACIDLDREIEKRTGETITDIFMDQGEARFRELEVRVLDQIILDHAQARPLMIALGAGYSGGIPDGFLTIWLQRPSDKQGRIFFDRPSLAGKHSAMNSLDEYHRFFQEREKRYQKLADFSIELPETPFEDMSLAEKCLFFPQSYHREVASVLTLRPNWVQPNLIKFFNQLGCDRFECRDDLIDGALLTDFDPRQLSIYSYREPQTSSLRESSANRELEQIDWAIELGDIPSGVQPTIVSLHESIEGEQLGDALARLESFSTAGNLLKAAPLVRNFQELALGHQWQQRDPQKRAFLPRCPQNSGRWKWYRQITRNLNPVHFYRLGRDSVSGLDQPTWGDLLDGPQDWTNFAAVLGNPIDHSYSPQFHRAFFKTFQIPFVAIQCAQKEWPYAINLLRQLGLKCAAITSPLKKLANSLLESVDSKDIGINTLFFDASGNVRGCATDKEGLIQLKQHIPEELLGELVVWGGAGVLNDVFQVFGTIPVYSARSGLVKIGEAKCFLPKVLIWAAGNQADLSLIPDQWPLELIIDLSYTSSSLGRELAKTRHTRYVSGEDMFIAQAQKQQDWWRFNLENDYE